MFLRIIIFILCSGVFFPLMAQRGVVKGRVVNVRNNKPLIGAIVRLENRSAATVTDSVGNYVIKQVKPGFYHITVSFLGYEKKRTEELQVMGNQTTFVDVAMNESEVSLTEAIIRPRTEETRAESPLSVQTLEVRQIEKSAGMNRDVSKLVQTLPGVAATAANRNDLLVRGGGPAENVFYLDGIELPVINHFTTQGAAGGAVGILNPDFISAVDFYTQRLEFGDGHPHERRQPRSPSYQALSGSIGCLAHPRRTCQFAFHLHLLYPTVLFADALQVARTALPAHLQ